MSSPEERKPTMLQITSVEADRIRILNKMAGVKQLDCAPLASCQDLPEWGSCHMHKRCPHSVHYWISAEAPGS